MSNAPTHVEFESGKGTVYVVREDGPFVGQIALQPADGSAPSRYDLADPVLDTLAEAHGLTAFLSECRAFDAATPKPQDAKDAQIAELKAQLAAKAAPAASTDLVKEINDLKALVADLAAKAAPSESLIRPDAGQAAQ